MDKAYVDFAALYEMEQAGAYLVTRAKQNMSFEVIETNYNIDEETGLVSDQIIVLTGVKYAKLLPKILYICFRQSIVFMRNAGR